MMAKISVLVLLVVVGMVLNVQSVFAHAGVSQREVGIGSVQTFTIGVPNESETESTVALRLLIPEGLSDVMPNVKAGWTINIKKSGEGEEAKITEITWSAGSIPPGQRDEVSLTAIVPAEETTLVWKTYQTYSDGDIVAWDTDPKVIAEEAKNTGTITSGHDDAGAKKPYSTTRVINDLKASPSPAADQAGNTSVAGSQSSNTPMMLSILAVLLSAGSIGMQFYKKNKTQK